MLKDVHLRILYAQTTTLTTHLYPTHTALAMLLGSSYATNPADKCKLVLLPDNYWL